MKRGLRATHPDGPAAPAHAVGRRVGPGPADLFTDGVGRRRCHNAY
jgi:hypothetical protein